MGRNCIGDFKVLYSSRKFLQISDATKLSEFALRYGEMDMLSGLP